MKSSIFLKPTFAVFLLLAIIASSAQNIFPRNYIGVPAIVEINRTAVSTGIEYERWLLTKNQFAVGAKIQYVFPSKTINYIFSSNDGIQRLRQLQLMASSYFFTDPEKQPSGFFLTLGAGINFIKWDITAYDGSGNNYIKSISETPLGFDLGLGGQFKKHKLTSRVTAGYQGFPTTKYSDFVSGKGISLFYLKISLGF